MALIARGKTTIKNRLFIVGSLFSLLLASSCDKSASLQKETIVVWNGNNAIGVQMRIENADPNVLTVHLENYPNQAILGAWEATDDQAEFVPLVPFTGGNTYNVYMGQKRLGQFKVEMRDMVVPEIIAIYPRADSLPENLLKMFIEFSIPMSEGEAYKHITVLDLDEGDTLPGTFLELKPELWNDDNTILTLWLDPGRIKRGLIPNLERGAPLEINKHYRLVISKEWRGGNSLSLASILFKEFYTTARDSISPIPANWVMELPAINTKEPLRVEFGESLDAVLALEVINIIDPKGNSVPGIKTLHEKESVFEFLPAQAWEAGEFMVHIENRLEDLAGNNLNRLFEEDMSSTRGKSDNKSTQLTFRLR